MNCRLTLTAEGGGPHELDDADVVDDELRVVLRVPDAAPRDKGLSAGLARRHGFGHPQEHVPDGAAGKVGQGHAECTEQGRVTLLH